MKEKDVNKTTPLPASRDPRQPYPPEYQSQYPYQQAPYPPVQSPYPPYQAPPPPAPPLPAPRPRRLSGCCSCVLGFVLTMVALLVVLALYFLAPLRTNFLLLGIDRVPEGTALGRTDTIILVSVNPLLPTVKMLSIPRDLWVPIAVDGVGENRINTAHFYAEANQPGSGPAATLLTVQQNFNVQVPYYLRVRFDAVLQIVDALGGVTLDLPQAMGGLPAGVHHLDGTQALAFVRDRKGTDDFFRMSQGQVMVKAIARQMLSPASWSRWPAVAGAVLNSVDTNLPFWQWPRIGLAILRGAVGNTIDSTTITREMTTPYITSGGANVLLPKWDLINPFVQSFIGQ